MDNGIKFFDAEGFKLPDEKEDEISAMVLDKDYHWPYPDSDKIGRATKIEDAGGRYIVYTKTCFPAGMTLSGLRIVVDCANGASYKVAPLALEELGAEVVRIGTEPNGVNINDHVGALHPETMASKVREVRADVGIALDGDADRLIMADEHGNILDGDQIMAMCAQDLMDREQLPGNAICATVMSNIALELYMKKHGGKLLRSKVGDRYVMEMMRREGIMFGGEQSGHLIFRSYSTTGDGLLSALQVLRILREKEKPLSEISHLLTLFPQKLVNVHVEKKLPFEERPAIGEAVKKVEAELGDRGRVLLRYSGTESLCRIMVECEDENKVSEYANELADVVARELR
jgi:phosphoglucosamine mutase